jgi:hypothetical protein
VTDPFLSAYWTIDQVIAWAQFRDADMVRRVVHANSHPSVVFKGLRLAAEQDQTIRVPDKGFYATSTEAEQAILEELKSGRLTAYDLENNKGDLKPVPRFQWATMRFYMDSKFKTYARAHATQWTILQLEREQVMAVFPDTDVLDTDLPTQIHKSDSESVTESDNKLLPVEKTKAIVKEQQAVEGLDRLAPIRQLELLTPSDISLTFLSGQIIKVSARDKSVCVTFGEIDLIDRRKRDASKQGQKTTVNEQGQVLVALANGKYDRPEAWVITRIRKIFKRYFGINSDPFDSYPKGILNPLFKIEDRSRAAEDKAKQDARNKQESYDEGSLRHNPQDQPSGTDDDIEQPYDEEYPFPDLENEEDEAAKIIRQHRKNLSG